MLKQYKKLEQDLYDRIYYVLGILHESSATNLNTYHLQEVIIETIHLQGTKVKVDTVYFDSYSDYEEKDSYTFPLRFVEEQVLDVEIEAYWLEEDNRLQKEYKKELNENNIHVEGFYIYKANYGSPECGIGYGLSYYDVVSTNWIVYKQENNK